MKSDLLARNASLTDLIATFVEALHVGFEVLKRDPENCSATQLKRYLRKVHVYQQSTASAELLVLELAYLLLETVSAHLSGCAVPFSHSSYVLESHTSYVLESQAARCMAV